MTMGIMRKTMTLTAMLLMTVVAGSLGAQNSQYTTTHENGTYICTSGRETTVPKNGSHTYATSFTLITFDENTSISLAAKITTIGDNEVVSVARLHKNGDVTNPYKTTATVTLESGDRIDISTATVTDVTAKDKKNSTNIGAAYIGLVIPYGDAGVIEELRKQNISVIEVEGHKIEMLQKVAVKTAPIVDRMFKEVINKGYRLNTTALSGASPSLAKNKNSVELVYYPLGILPKDVSGITLSSVLNDVKSRTNWKIDEYPTFFATYASGGYDITWHGLPIFTAQMSFGNYLNWYYSIHLARSEYSRSQAELYTKLFIKELKEEGFSEEKGSLEGDPKYPISKKLRKGTYNISVTLIVSDGDDFSISVYSYPNG